MKGSFAGELITPSNPKYFTARQEWNRAIQKYPLAIAYCETEHDVSQAICWARRKSTDIRIRSGGHHYEGFSTGNNVLVIDISRLNGFSLDESRGTVTVDGGIQNHQLYDAVASRGYPFPGGTCPTVGVSGYMLGGGWGYSTRLFGLGCDSLLSLRMVNSEGNIVTASETENPHLFWACRGAGGGNFGIVASMIFRLPPKADKVTLVEIYYPNASKSTMQRFLNTWQFWLPNLDRRMTLGASLYQSAEEGPGIYCRGLFFGTPYEANLILKPLGDIEGAEVRLENLSFYDARQKVMSTYPESEKFKSGGRFVNRCYSPCDIKNIVSLIDKPAQGFFYTAVSVYALGGAVRDKCSGDTAFFWRDAPYIMGIQSVWLQDRYKNDNLQWMEERYSLLKSFTSGAYVNFPYYPLENFDEQYYGANAGWLRAVKNKYDPTDIFTFPQSIRTETPC